MIKLKAVVLIAVTALAGCAVPTLPIEIRPGVGSDVDFDGIRPPSGKTYRYVLENEGVPVPVTVSLRSRRLSASKYTYNGQMVVTLPEAGNLEDIANVLSDVLGKTSIRVRGNQLLVPVGLKADNRFRSTSSNITGDVTRYAPHDCFAVIGSCRYKASDRNGFTVSLLTTTTEKNGVWQSRTVLDPKAKNPKGPFEARRSVYSIDANAVLIDMFILRTSRGQRTSFAMKRI